MITGNDSSDLSRTGIGGEMMQWMEQKFQLMYKKLQTKVLPSSNRCTALKCSMECIPTVMRPIENTSTLIGSADYLDKGVR